MSEQLSFDFPTNSLPFPPAHPIVILRWDADAEMVTSEWPELKLKAKFQDWFVALDLVLPPSNAHVKLLVRT